MKITINNDIEIKFKGMNESILNPLLPSAENMRRSAKTLILI